jgi:hypothetical protein
MPRLVVVISVIISFVLVGCAPLPYIRTSKPEITGVLLLGGVAIPDLLITSCAKGQLPGKCVKVRKTTTDSQGEFFFGAEWDYEKLVPYIGDQKFNYGIGFQYLGRDYHWNEGGVGDTPKSVNLRCEIRNNVLCTVEVTEP